MEKLNHCHMQQNENSTSSASRVLFLFRASAVFFSDASSSGSSAPPGGHVANCDWPPPARRGSHLQSAAPVTGLCRVQVRSRRQREAPAQVERPQGRLQSRPQLGILTRRGRSGSSTLMDGPRAVSGPGEAFNEFKRRPVEIFIDLFLALFSQDPTRLREVNADGKLPDL